MAQVYTDIKVSLTKQMITPTIQMTQGDNGRGLRIFVSDDIITNSDGINDKNIQAILWAEKPSGLKVSLEASEVVNYDNTAYQLIFNGSDTFANILAEVGVVKVQCTLMQGGTFVTTFLFKIAVQQNIAMSTDLVSKQEIRNAIDFFQYVDNAKERVDDIIARGDNQVKLTSNVRFGEGEPTVQPTDKVGDIYIRVKVG